MILLLGRNGVLASAVQREFTAEELHLVDRETIIRWTEEDAIISVKEYLEKLEVKPTLIINAAGVLNPAAPQSELLKVNVHLPTNLVRAAEEFDIKVVTFGSIMENFPEISESNGYLKSKYMYKDFLVRNAGSTSKTLHLQIHTWYGGIRLHKHMFLGQMFEAISKRKPFEMSSGNQIREYHLISDDVRAIRHLVDLDSTGITRLNHGQSHSLKTIADYVFSSFGVTELLHVGTLPNPTRENFSTNFARPKSLETIVFRDSLPGIANYFQSLIGRQS